MLTKEQLQVIEDCGSAEMPLDETAIIAECEISEIVNNPDARKRYHKGQLQSKLKIRQSVVKMAREGVPQMVKIYNDFTKTVLPDADRPLDEEFDADLPDLPDLPESAESKKEPES